MQKVYELQRLEKNLARHRAENPNTVTINFLKFFLGKTELYNAI